jgi:hypothetical protein
VRHRVRGLTATVSRLSAISIVRIIPSIHVIDIRSASGFNMFTSVMGWFRTKQVAIAWVALFALACQLVLSYGHVHSGTFSSGKFSAGLVTLALAAEGAQSSADPLVPPQKSPTGFPDFCAICASIGLAGTLLVPESPVIAAPTPSIQILPWSLAAVEPASFDHLLFNARGPPKA